MRDENPIEWKTAGATGYASAESKAGFHKSALAKPVAPALEIFQ